MSELLRLEGVSRAVRLPNGELLWVLRGVSLVLAAGEILAVTGPSGSGKSTLLAIAGLLDTPTEGDVWVDGRNYTRSWERERAAVRRRMFGYVFQRFWLLPHCSALENAELPLAQRGVGRRERRRRAAAMLARFGLAERMAIRPAALSGGEQQRVGIARALLAGPAVVIADEPTGSLDRATAGEVLACLVAAAREQGSAVLIATHDPEVAAAADRCLRLEAGRLC